MWYQLGKGGIVAQELSWFTEPPPSAVAASPLRCAERLSLSVETLIFNEAPPPVDAAAEQLGRRRSLNMIGSSSERLSLSAHRWGGAAGKEFRVQSSGFRVWSFIVRSQLSIISPLRH